MVTIKMEIQDLLYEQASVLAEQMQISPNELFSSAIADYLQRKYKETSSELITRCRILWFS